MGGFFSRLDPLLAFSLTLSVNFVVTNGGVIGVAGPLHDDVGRDAHGEGVAYEGAAAGVGA